MAELTDREEKIIKQIEYYFGDSNLPRDRFLQDLIKKEDGWIPVETMTKFNRLKQITDDISVIAEAVKKSTSGLMEVSEDNTKIRRSPDKPMPENTEERRQDVTARTCYAKLFPPETTLDELMAFFETFGPVESIFMRKDANKDFKGSVFTTFKSKDDLDKFLKPDIVNFKGFELEARKTKSDYYKDKQEERKQMKEKLQQKGKQARERQEGDQKNKIKNQLTKGAMLHIKGFSKETKREDIKNFLQDYGQIAWVDFNSGDTEGTVRYDEENQAADVLGKLTEAMTDGIVLNGSKLECRVLEGEEELERWVKMFKDIAERKQSFKKSKSKFGRKQGGGKYGKRLSKGKRDAAKRAAAQEEGSEGDDSGGSGSEDDEKGEPAEKKAKTDESEAVAAGGD